MQQMTIDDFTKPQFKLDRDKPIRLIELFAGIGSQAMALRDLCEEYDYEWENYRVIEFDKYAIKSYNAIHGTDYPTIDITNVKGVDLGIVNKDKYQYIMTYSFPCQSISIAGKQHGFSKGSSTRSGLLWEVERLLNELDELPDVLIMENVPQIHSKKFMSDFQMWIDALTDMGYHSFWQDMNAKDYEIPQSRNRTFMVSILKDEIYHFPQPIPLTTKISDYLEDEVDEKYYVNSGRALELIRNLLERNILPDEGGSTVDFTTKNPNKISCANCINGHERGVSAVSQYGNGVFYER